MSNSNSYNPSKSIINNNSNSSYSSNNANTNSGKAVPKDNPIVAFSTAKAKLVWWRLSNELI